MRHLEEEIEELEIDRTRLRYKLRNISQFDEKVKSGSLFSDLTEKQKGDIQKYIKNLKAGDYNKIPLTDKSKQLFEENKKLKLQLENSKSDKNERLENTI